MTPRGFDTWEELYQNQEAEKMPWFHPALDDDVDAAIKDLNLKQGRALDIGCGPGTQAIALAQLGFEVNASDISAAAVEGAKERAKKAGVDVHFIVDDILHSQLEGLFDLIIDRGCFHVFEVEDRPRYIEQVRQRLHAGGVLLLKTFSHHEGGSEGPHRFHPDEIRQLFSPHFDIESIEESVYNGTREPIPKALFTIMRRNNK